MLPVDGEERKLEGLDTEVDRTSLRTLSSLIVSNRYPWGGPYIICYLEGSGDSRLRLSSVAVVENQQRPKSSVLRTLRRIYQKQQKKQVEHQLEEEKKANNEKQKAKRELETSSRGKAVIEWQLEQSIREQALLKHMQHRFAH
ncbi:golgin subfamily A member 8C-like isoform X4 [Macaca fascicularis]|uniref:golgin subfamily A member 8C-like isoform X4 n=1 Tax=Macaca fascicularis TaxID=9541 RepID=UPI0032B069A0